MPERERERGSESWQKTFVVLTQIDFKKGSREEDEVAGFVIFSQSLYSYF